MQGARVVDFPLAYVWIQASPSKKACYPFGDGRLFFSYWEIDGIPMALYL